MTIEEFIKGKKVKCEKHCKVKGMGVEIPYCLWCGKKL